MCDSTTCPIAALDREKKAKRERDHEATVKANRASGVDIARLKKRRIMFRRLMGDAAHILGCPVWQYSRYENELDPLPKKDYKKLLRRFSFYGRPAQRLRVFRAWLKMEWSFLKMRRKVWKALREGGMPRMKLPTGKVLNEMALMYAVPRLPGETDDALRARIIQKIKGGKTKWKD